MARIMRSVQYRYLDRKRANIGSDTLETVLRNALVEKRDGDTIGKSVRARIADLEQSGQLTVWNGLQGLKTGGVLAGELILYKQGFNVTAIEEALDNDGERFKLVNYQTDGKNKPVEGALYFAVVGDHLGIIQSNAVTGKWLERYFTWLLKDISGLIEAESVIHLDARISMAGRDVRKEGAAQALTLHAKPSARASDGRSKRDLRERASGGGGTVLEVLELLGVGKDVIASIAEDVPEGGRLEGDFLVYIKEGRFRRPISTDTLDHAFRNAQPGDIDIQRKGSRVRDNAVSFSEAVRVLDTPVGLDPSDAIEQIITVLYRWNELGAINLGPS